MLAERLGYPFVELNRVVEQEYGAHISMLIEMSGVSTFRRYERASLEKVIGDHDKVVIATAGGIVSTPETYALLLRRAHTVWIKAQPQEHMSRVMAQGDLRPMSENREAMADLVAILEARRRRITRRPRRNSTPPALRRTVEPRTDRRPRSVDSGLRAGVDQMSGSRLPTRACSNWAGKRLEYRMIGPRPDAAPTLVMLHEGLGCVGMWGDFPDKLAAATGCGVFVYSRAGYGKSSPVTLAAADQLHA